MREFTLVKPAPQYCFLGKEEKKFSFLNYKKLEMSVWTVYLNSQPYKGITDTPWFVVVAVVVIAVVVVIDSNPRPFAVHDL